MSYCIFGAVIGTAFALGVYASLDYIDDRLVNQRLAQEIDYLTDQIKRQSTPPKPHSSNIKVFLGMEGMSPNVREMIRNISEGMHEVHHEGSEYHIVVKEIPGYDEPLYVLYNVSALEFTEKRRVMIMVVLIAGVFLVVGLGFWIGLLTSRKVIAPVVQLAEQVDKTGPDKLPLNLSKSFYNDEVGTLAKALEEAMQRIGAFIRREQQFTRDASHELRTPLTITKGAVELLDRQISDQTPSLARPLSRIKRAVSDMENIIETFLWLAREDTDVDSTVSSDVASVIQDAVDQHRHVINNKPIGVEVNIDGRPVLNVPTPVIRTAVVNIIQNAFQNTVEGKVVILVKADRVSVLDTGKGIASEDLSTVTDPHVRDQNSSGFGLGLAIVKRLCNRFGWNLKIESEEGKGTRVHLIFN